MLRLVQSTIQSPRHDLDPTFAFAVWVGAIGGAALPTDPNPNTTPPSSTRIITLSAKKDGLAPMGLGSVRILCGVVAASSITTQPWFFDNTQNLWLTFGAPLVITPTGAAVNFANVTLAMIGAKVFVQITANTLVQALGYDYF